ncbi:3' terminal RNA ribose 2'-O-methyltransferase Hen1 (plasmid) [Deinococcus taeanensis]|uniref:3' terminal RNA ribose 2'-O-methyltransferase Hen1 n=1 Tax=Deinococcus taeanensis TaxID=2737050 RepID=UPI001CDD88E9|nr:3' terminal RNA ribose 2'-O-methyltransferase Hen1 [Deinococcus taeanensis]UBV45361.1 3' terminal RNA ribose 2'-O-methyltransferase Hen1 [Deinococcus taeanensis]
MLLTILTTHAPATDLGYLLHKNPARPSRFDLPVGQGHVFYPEATPERCTVALLVEVDSVVLSRGRAGASGLPLEPYVNDRPYAASSFLSSAMREGFGTAMTGRSKERPELAAQTLPFEVHLPALPSRGDVSLAERMFRPLGYQVTAGTTLLDESFPEWGQSPYLDLKLEGTVRLQDLLAHLYVLIPVLDDTQHYYVDEAEIDKLLRYGAGWLDAHPERDLITRRFLKHRRALQRAAQAHFTDDDGPGSERPATPTLNEQRLEALKAALVASGAVTVLDLGCGEGNLLAKLLPERQFTRLLGLDVSPRVLARARDNLRLNELPESYRNRLTLTQGSLTYRDTRLQGFEAAALVEVIEHLDEGRLWTLERVVFGDARPSTVVVKTPTEEFNARWASLPAGDTRHADHRFEWTRAQFQPWAERVADEFGYAVTFQDVGEVDAHLGPPTQMAVFRLEAL